MINNTTRTTIPSEAAKNARTWLTKWRSSPVSFVSQSVTSVPKSISGDKRTHPIFTTVGQSDWQKNTSLLKMSRGSSRGCWSTNLRRSKRKPRPSCTWPTHPRVESERVQTVSKGFKIRRFGQKRLFRRRRSKIVTTRFAGRTLFSMSIGSNESDAEQISDIADKW